jgi:hypothetical protein
MTRDKLGHGRQIAGASASSGVPITAFGQDGGLGQLGARERQGLVAGTGERFGLAGG